MLHKYTPYMILHIFQNKRLSVDYTQSYVQLGTFLSQALVMVSVLLLLSNNYAEPCF